MTNQKEYSRIYKIGWDNAIIEVLDKIDRIFYNEKSKYPIVSVDKLIYFRKYIEGLK